MLLMLPALFFFWGGGHAAFGILVPRPGIEPTSPALEAHSLNHWITREVRCCLLYILIFSHVVLSMERPFLPARTWPHFQGPAQMPWGLCQPPGAWSRLTAGLPKHFSFTSVLALVTHNSQCSYLQTCLILLTKRTGKLLWDGGGRYILSLLLLLSTWHRVNSQYIIDELNFTLHNNPVISWPLVSLLPVGCSRPSPVLQTVCSR